MKPWKGSRDVVHECVDVPGLEKTLAPATQMEKTVDDKHGLMNETCMLLLLKIVTVGMGY